MDHRSRVWSGHSFPLTRNPITARKSRSKGLILGCYRVPVLVRDVAELPTPPKVRETPRPPTAGFLICGIGYRLSLGGVSSLIALTYHLRLALNPSLDSKNDDSPQGAIA